MSRTSDSGFGSFRERISSAVFANGWWIFLASEVQLEGEDPLRHALEPFLPACAERLGRLAPPKFTRAWFQEAAPIGLQLQPGQCVSSPLGFVACRVQANGRGETEDVAYPFLVVVREEDIDLCFSRSGPA